MQAIKCSNCGFTGFAGKGCCKRCGHTLESPNKSHSPRRSEMDGLTSRWLKNPLVLVVLLVVVIAMAGAAVVRAKWEKYFDRTPAYMEAISKSSQFREALTVRVNQKEICIHVSCALPADVGRRAGKATRAADVLEALGLLTMSTEATFITKQAGVVSEPPIYNIAGVYVSPGGWAPRFIEVKSERLIIALTDEGSKQAVNWRETVEPYFPNTQQPKMYWWRIPIGEREITRFEFVREVDANTVRITFRWRWRPNKIGESFDCSSAAVQSLPQKGRHAAVSLGWNSQTEYEAFAELRRSGNFWTVWEVTQINYPIDVTQRD